MTPAFASLPLLTVLALMLGLRWRAVYAGPGGLVMAVVIALQNRSGAIRTLREAFGRISAEPRSQVGLIAWFFAATSSARTTSSPAERRSGCPWTNRGRTRYFG